jgi:hypothetical protein
MKHSPSKACASSTSAPKSSVAFHRLNYFNYFTEIEDAFVRRRGKHLMLSPLDWALIETWQQIGIPLHIVLRSIERAFDLWESKPRKRSVKSLLYCQEEVEAQYAEWLEAHVGATESEPANDRNETFSKTAILEHLERAKLALQESLDRRKQLGEDDLSEALTRALALLKQIIEDLATTATPDTRRLEDSLTTIERMLNDAVQSTAAAEQLEALRKEVKQQMKKYKAQMEQPVYQQMFDNLLQKRLREEFAVPRLSLFHL